MRPQAALQVSCSDITTCSGISAALKALHHSQESTSHRPLTPSPVVIRQLFPRPDTPPGEDDYMIAQQACRCATYCYGPAVGVGLAGVVQQVRHVACTWREQLSTRHRHSAAASLALHQDAGRYEPCSAQEMREARQKWSHRRVSEDVPSLLGQVRPAEDTHGHPSGAGLNVVHTAAIMLPSASAQCNCTCHAMATG